MSTKKTFSLIGLGLGALFLMGAGCGQTTSNTNATTNTNGTTVTVNGNSNKNTNATMEEADYEVEIITPEDGDVVELPLTVEMAVEGFTLSDDVEGENVDGEGHVHLWVDGEYNTFTATESVEVTELEAGEHELMVSLQNNDHTDLDPVVKSESVTVTVE